MLVPRRVHFGPLDVCWLNRGWHFWGIRTHVLFFPGLFSQRFATHDTWSVLWWIWSEFTSLDKNMTWTTVRCTKHKRVASWQTYVCIYVIWPYAEKIMYQLHEFFVTRGYQIWLNHDGSKMWLPGTWRVCSFDTQKPWWWLPSFQPVGCFPSWDSKLQNMKTHQLSLWTWEGWKGGKTTSHSCDVMLTTWCLKSIL